MSMPPLAIVKNFAPNNRSIVINFYSIVKTGKANTIMTFVIRIDHVNIGIFIKLMPDARIYIIIRMKLIHFINFIIPVFLITIEYYFEPSVSLKSLPANGKYEVHTASGDPAIKNDILNNIAPIKNNQKLSAFNLGNATSRATICNGTITYINQKINGIAMNKIITTPCVVNISL